MDGWKPSFFLGCPVLRCELLVSGRVDTNTHTQLAKQFFEKIAISRLSRLGNVDDVVDSKQYPEIT